MSWYLRNKRMFSFQVASRHVFIAMSIIYIVLGVLAKVSAVFISIPYPVLGGSIITIIGTSIFHCHWLFYFKCLAFSLVKMKSRVELPSLYEGTDDNWKKMRWKIHTCTITWILLQIELCWSSLYFGLLEINYTYLDFTAVFVSFQSVTGEIY